MNYTVVKSTGHVSLFIRVTKGLRDKWNFSTFPVSTLLFTLSRGDPANNFWGDTSFDKQVLTLGRYEKIYHSLMV